MQVHCHSACHLQLQQVCKQSHSLHMLDSADTRPALAVPPANLHARAQHKLVHVHACELLCTCFVQSMSGALSNGLAHQSEAFFLLPLPWPLPPGVAAMQALQAHAACLASHPWGSCHHPAAAAAAVDLLVESFQTV